ncbi:response regulator [Bacteroides fragilis]
MNVELKVNLLYKMENEEIKSLRPLILVAEDDDSNFKLIKAIIGKKCDILWAKNGEEMLNLYRDHGKEAWAILMDIKMPIMNGLEATRIIRQQRATLPIIMQTAYAFSSDRDNAIEAGATEVLVKPITVSALRNCLNSYFPEIQW